MRRKEVELNLPSAGGSGAANGLRDLELGKTLFLFYATRDQITHAHFCGYIDSSFLKEGSQKV